jgi:uncharacterized protein involved in type VI secretion and phage assembly
MNRLPSPRVRPCLETLENRLVPARLDYLLEIDRVTGETPDKGHETHIELVSFHFGDAQTGGQTTPPANPVSLPFTDQFGRVKVKFFWDRQGGADAGESVWIRTMSTWAGKQWGTVVNPRIGQEVIVDFLEGDPDRPLITGRVYNAEQMPPFTPAAKKTPGRTDFNEIVFEDKKGSEFIYIRGERDQGIKVENDEAHWVGHDRQKTIDHDETIRGKSLHVDANEEIIIKTGSAGIDMKQTGTIEVKGKDITVCGRG